MKCIWIFLLVLLSSFLYAYRTTIDFGSPEDGELYCPFQSVNIEVQIKKQLKLVRDDDFDETSRFHDNGYYNAPRGDKLHWGEDIGYIGINRELVAPYDMVMRAKLTQRCPIRNENDSIVGYRICGYGHYCAAYVPEIDKTLLFGHLASQPTVDANEVIHKGDFFAIGSNTGGISLYHLHIEVLDGDCLYSVENGDLELWESIMNKEWRHPLNENPRTYLYASEYESMNDSIFVLIDPPESDNVYFHERLPNHCFCDYSSNPIDHDPLVRSYSSDIDDIGNYSVQATYKDYHEHITVETTAQNGSNIPTETRSTTYTNNVTYEKESCAIVILQKTGFVNGQTKDDDRFDPNNNPCNLLRSLSTYVPILKYTTENDAVVVATGVVYFRPGDDLELTHSVVGSSPSLTYSVTQPGKATWRFSATREDLDDSPTVRIKAKDLDRNITDETGLWYMQGFSVGTTKTYFSTESTSLFFECPYCPQNRDMEDSSWTATGNQRTYEMQMEIRPTIRFRQDRYNTNRIYYTVEKVADLEMTTLSHEYSYGFTRDLVGCNSYSWSANGGYSNQSSFDLLGINPDHPFFHDWSCCHRVGVDCPCHKYECNCTFDNFRCSNMNPENFIFPEWLKEASIPGMKNTFSNTDSLVPSRAIITRDFSNPAMRPYQEDLVAQWGDNTSMIVSADSVDVHWPIRDWDDYEYYYDKPSNPISDEDTLETLAIPNDYQIPIIAKPNPFNTEVSISFELEHEEKCVVSIYDIEGSLREVIFDGIVSSRSKTLSWQCSSCPSGTYFVVVTTPSTYSTKRISLVK